jgi:hypothetical protein
MPRQRDQLAVEALKCVLKRGPIMLMEDVGPNLDPELRCDT